MVSVLHTNLISCRVGFVLSCFCKSNFSCTLLWRERYSRSVYWALNLNINVFQEYPRGQTIVLGESYCSPETRFAYANFQFPATTAFATCIIKNLSSYLYMLYQWKAYSLSACSVFVSLTDLWTTTIIDIISSWQEEKSRMNFEKPNFCRRC